MQVVSHPTPEEEEHGRKCDGLWLLVGGGPDYHNGAIAYYLGPDYMNVGEDAAQHNLPQIAQQNRFDLEEALEALESYRHWARIQGNYGE
jgi:hypothetical protein